MIIHLYIRYELDIHNQIIINDISNYFYLEINIMINPEAVIDFVKKTKVPNHYRRIIYPGWNMGKTDSFTGAASLTKIYSPPEYNLYDELTEDDYYLIHGFLYMEFEIYEQEDYEYICNNWINVIDIRPVLCKVYNIEIDDYITRMLCHRILEGTVFHNNEKECDDKLIELKEWGKYIESIQSNINEIESIISKYMFLDLPFTFDDTKYDIYNSTITEIHDYCDSTITGILFEQFQKEFKSTNHDLFDLAIQLNDTKYAKRIDESLTSTDSLRYKSADEFHKIISSIPNVFKETT